MCQITQNYRLFFWRYGGRLSLTLLEKSDKVNKMNALMKPSKRTHPFSENCRLVQGSKRTTPNTFLSGSAEHMSRRRRVRPVLRYGLLGPDEAANAVN